MSRGRKGVNYYLVIKDYMFKIKDSIIINPRQGLSFNGTASMIVQILIDKGVIINCGSKVKPNYAWDDAYEINDKTAKEITKLVRAMNLMWHRRHLFKKEQEEKKVEPVKEAVVKPVVEEPSLDIAVEKPVIVAVAEMNKTPITAFSDAELWNELKARGYEAVSGFIQKTQVTTLQ